MDVHKTPLLAVFDSKQRLEVPLFQRQYVWNEEHQWQPLWEDIERKFTESLEAREYAPVHFLGAMVLDQKQTPTGHVVIRQVIDGQQRLTTLQIFLAAYRDFCRSENCEALAAECDKFLFNTGMMANPEVDKFKIWPTQKDRHQFIDVISAGSREEVTKRHPLKRKPYARKDDPRPRMVEAYLFFFNCLSLFFLGEDGETALRSEVPIVHRVDECFQALRSALMVVVIDLQKDDDPQVIFETLNARGEPLLPADLLRNYIFFRANRDGFDIEAIYTKYWSRFDDEFWREQVNQGRLLRPRSDLFMQHFLSSRQGQDIPIKHLYVEYRHWLEREKPFPDVEAELATLARQGEDFRRILAPKNNDVIFGLCSFLNAYDIRTVYPLLLAVLDAGLVDEELKAISLVLESYFIRRAVCNLGTKNYNRIFLNLTKNLRKDEFSAARIRDLLSAQSGESVVWPDDSTFRGAWLENQIGKQLNNPKLVHIFSQLNQSYMSNKSESVIFATQPTIEHIMPQNWIANWPLEDGAKGMGLSEWLDTPDDDPRKGATDKRDGALQTLGNLTILSSGLNSSQSNCGWDQKRPKLMKNSLLPINQMLCETTAWDESAIRKRGESLFEQAVRIWPR